jgi:hypothetical protein
LRRNVHSHHIASYWTYSGIESGHVKNILLEEKYQNAEWFQVSKVTIVHFNIIFHYNVQKMNSTHLTIEGYAGELATAWGVVDRGRPGVKPAINRIPQKQNIRDKVMDKSDGPRYILNMKRLSDAIVKGNIVMVINDHFRGGPQPKCAHSISMPCTEKCTVCVLATNIIRSAPVIDVC